MICGTMSQHINLETYSEWTLTLPTQYATNMAAAVQLFFVAPATLLIPVVMIKLTTGPKNPIIV